MEKLQDCVAAPIYDYRRQIIASVSVAAASDIFTPERDKETGRHVIETVRSILRRLGYVYSSSK